MAARAGCQRFRTGPFRFLLGLLLLFSHAGLAYSLEAQQPEQAILRLHRLDQVPTMGGEALWVLHGDAGERLEVRLVVGKTLDLRVPAGSTWQTEVGSPELWAPSMKLTAGAAGTLRENTIRFWPGTRVEGALERADKGDNLPRQLTLELASPPSPGRKQEVEKEEVPCGMAPQGRFSCAVPAAFLDLTLKAKEYAPVYFRGKWPAAAAPLNLGVVALRPGGSISGWATTEGGDVGAPGAVAKVSPFLGPGQGSQAEIERLQRAAFEAKVTERGFFQVTGLSPGDYLLELSKAGLAPAKAFPLRVFRGAETVLREPMVLRPPIVLAVSVQPPLDWLGKPWQLEIRRHSDWSGGFEHPEVFVGAADETGRVAIPRQGPGRYAVNVADSKGNRLYFGSDLKVSGFEDAELRVEVPLVIVDGEISFDDKPVPAQLRFGGSFGAVAVEMEAGEDGVFSGVLPREGKWRVDIRVLEPEIRTHATVEVKAAAEGIAPVKIEVPNTRVFGFVVGPESQPLKDAQVLLETSAAPQQVTSAAEGQFEFLGIPEGPILLSAQAQLADGPAASETLTLELTEEIPQGPVFLRVERNVEIHGKVESPLGAVAGASLSAWSLVPPSPQMESARSGLDGTFKLRAPARCQRVAVAVSPPGYALTVLEITPFEGSIGTLRVEADGGDLEVALPFTPKPGEEPELSPVLFRGDLAIPLSVLSRWAAGNGKAYLEGNTLRVPHIASGQYKACLIPRNLEREMAAAEPLSAGVCKDVFVPVGGLARVELKAPARQRPGSE